MCDYSLNGIPNRLAREGEVLVVHRFHTGSKGLTSPEFLKSIERRKGLLALFTQLLGFPAQRKECAVCIPDGATLVLHGISPRLQRAHSLSSAEVVTFRQLSMDEHIYRDALEFRSGARVRLQDLNEGQNVEVVALSSGYSDVVEEKLIRVRA